MFAQGSYRNRTTVPRDSDVDICVMARGVFMSSWDWVEANASSERIEELQREAEIRSITDYDFPTYKNEVEAALVDHFERAFVKRGDKAFDIHENTYRVESDCLAAWKYRNWRRNSFGRLESVDGVTFQTDKGVWIENYPDQQFERGEIKHALTAKHYRSVVRILKNLRNEMADEGNKAAEPIPSFLIECLVWNVPNSVFGNRTWYVELREALRTIYLATEDDERCKEWLEANGVKFLFHWQQGWTRAQANAFILAAWSEVGYE